MQTLIKESCLKQMAGLPKDVRERIEIFVFETLPALETIGESGKIEKMHGYKSCFKVRSGEYGLGIVFEDNVVTVKIVMHRREVYRFFP